MPQGRPAWPAPDEQAPGTWTTRLPPYVRRDRRGVAVAHGAAAGGIASYEQEGAADRGGDLLERIPLAQPVPRGCSNDSGIDAPDGARHLLRGRVVEPRVAEPTACHDVVEGSARTERVGEPAERGTRQEQERRPASPSLGDVEDDSPELTGSFGQHAFTPPSMIHAAQRPARGPLPHNRAVASSSAIAAAALYAPPQSISG